MSRPSLIPYPPCVQATIERDNPYVTVVIVSQHSFIDRSSCCNRVYLFLDDNSKLCLFPPRIG
ncbi:hypothetical protein ACJIZ3_006175 [Penstemon smallii]|uniref:Uncharacterized protein n=1 Tax=Penstemon smallii TaxID=265156 RepID=A0ABD3S792_9LAMI